MTDAVGRWSLRCAALCCAALRQSFTEVRSTCGNRGSIELNWAWLSAQDNSPLRAYLLSRGGFRCNRGVCATREGASWTRCFLAWGLRGSMKQCPGQSWRLWTGEVEMAASRGVGACVGWLVESGPTLVFSQGGAASPQLQVGRVNRVLFRIIVDCKPACVLPRAQPTSNRPITQIGTPLNLGRQTDSHRPAFPRDGPWRRCQFQPSRSRSPLEDYPIRIDKHVRDMILLGRLVISTTVIEPIVLINSEIHTCKNGGYTTWAVYRQALNHMRIRMPNMLTPDLHA